MEFMMATPHYLGNVLPNNNGPASRKNNGVNKKIMGSRKKKGPSGQQSGHWHKIMDPTPVGCPKKGPSAHYKKLAPYLLFGCILPHGKSP